ncbi:hypothetical protein BDW62DRAFT_79812 [Aspergillus aurantiobrunneus]
MGVEDGRFEWKGFKNFSGKVFSNSTGILSPARVGYESPPSYSQSPTSCRTASPVKRGAVGGHVVAFECMAWDFSLRRVLEVVIITQETMIPKPTINSQDGEGICVGDGDGGECGLSTSSGRLSLAQSGGFGICPVTKCDREVEAGCQTKCDRSCFVVSSCCPRSDPNHGWDVTDPQPYLLLQLVLPVFSPY